MATFDYSCLSRQELMSLLTDRDISIPQNRILSRDELVSLLVTAQEGWGRDYGVERARNPLPPRAGMRVSLPQSHSKSPVRVGPLQGAGQPRNLDLSPMRRRQADTLMLSKAMEGSFPGSSQSFFSYSWLLSLIVVVVLAYVSYPLLAYALSDPAPFCSGEAEFKHNCQPCPLNADCAGGQMTCRRPYIRDGSLCIENKELTQHMHALLRDVETAVGEKNAEVYTRNREEYRGTLDDVKRLVPEKKGEDDTWKEMQRYLKSGEYRGSIRVKPHHGELIFSTTLLPLSYTQQLSIFYNDNFYTLLTYLLLSISLIYFLIFLSLTRRRYSQSLSAFSVIKSQLQKLNDGSLTHGMSEDDIREVLRAHTGESGLERLWPLVEGMRAAEARMCKFQQLVGGRPVIYWQWKGNSK